MKEPDWTWKEIDFLRTNYSKMTNAELARKLGRTYGATIMFNDALAKWLGISVRTLTRKARELGLKKREDFYELKRDVWVERQREGLRRVECATRIKSLSESS